MSTSRRTEMLLSVQRALLGEVTPSMRVVTVACDDTAVRLTFYFDGPITAADREAAYTARPTSGSAAHEAAQRAGGVIGVYSTEQSANDAVARLSLQPGFREHAEGFQVSPYELDKDHWEEGFVSWKEAME